MTGEASLTAIDVRLLAALQRTRNLVHACREVGIDRDRAVYRLRRLDRLYGSVTGAARGGAHGGGTWLTARGRRLLARAQGTHARANRWTGTYHRGPYPRVELDPSSQLDVAFRWRDGGTVAVEVDPEAIVVAPRAVPLSARNALRAVVEAIRRRADGTVELTARWNGRQVRVALTEGSVGRLGLAVGRPAYLYVKATSLRRLAAEAAGA
jgi:molybdate transport repressor ModE-like protein/molybdopterin-binding protein